jgi:CHASE3 domain sensor protein
VSAFVALPDAVEDDLQLQHRAGFELQCCERNAGDIDVKKLTVGLAREWMIALIVVCIVILVLIGIATWWVA